MARRPGGPVPVASVLNLQRVFALSLACDQARRGREGLVLTWISVGCRLQGWLGQRGEPHLAARGVPQAAGWDGPAGPLHPHKSVTASPSLFERELFCTIRTTWPWSLGSESFRPEGQPIPPALPRLVPDGQAAASAPTALPGNLLLIF